MVKYVWPKHYQEQVALNEDIIVTFVTPLDAATVNDSNVWVIQEGNITRHPGTVSYEQTSGTYRIRFSPSVNYQPNTTYQVTIRGESEEVVDTADVDEGIKDAFGYSIKGDYVWTFTTGDNTIVAEPELIYPSDKSSIDTTPTFQWSSVNGANEYEIIVSENPSFESAEWTTTTTQTELAPPIPLDNREHWWKVRAIDASGNAGAWSEVWSFYKGDIDIGYIAPEDQPIVDYPLELDIQRSTTSIAVTNMYPAANQLNVPLNLSYVALELNGYVSPSLVSADTFKLVGQPFTKDYEYMDDQTWWQRSVVRVEPPVGYESNKTAADHIRSIEAHGEVNMKRITVYDPSADKTIILGVFDTKRSVSDKDYEMPVVKTTTTVRLTPAGVIDGYNKSFKLPNEPIDNTLEVYIDGVMTTEYTLTDNIIEFNIAPAIGTNIEAMYETGYMVIEKLAGKYDGHDTVYYLTRSPINSSLVIYKNDNTLVELIDYTINNNEITFIEPPIETDEIYAKYYAQLNFIRNEQPSGVIDGVNTVFTLSTQPIVNSEQVFIDGLLLLRGTDYTISADTITFTTAPVPGSIILCEYFTAEPYMINDIPSGVIDGNNKTFTLLAEPEPITFELYKNGMLLKRNEYVLSGNTVELAVAPVISDVLQASYQIAGSGTILYPKADSINFLLPNNKYTLTFSTDDYHYSNWFTSQYWPLFADISEVRVELANIVDISDEELYYLVRQKSIDAIFIQTSPFHYLIDSAEYPYGKMTIPFDPNDPVYCVYKYVLYRTAYDILVNAYVSAGANSGGQKQLGELTIRRGDLRNIIGGPGRGGILGALYDKLKPWEDCIHGHTGVGRAHSTGIVRGVNNYDQYNNDYPLDVRIPYSNRQYIYNRRWHNTL